MKKYNKRAYWVFWITVMLVVVVSMEMFVPVVNEAVGGKLFLVPLFLVSVGGGVLVYYVRATQWNVQLQRRFLLLAGTATLAFFPAVVLHNVLYALGIMSEGMPLLAGVMNVLSAGVFILAVIVCPIAFLVGVIGTLWLLPHNVRK